MEQEKSDRLIVVRLDSIVKGNKSIIPINTYTDSFTTIIRETS